MRAYFLIVAMLAAVLANPAAAAEKYDGKLDLKCFGKHHVYKDLPTFQDYAPEKPFGRRAKDIDWNSDPKAREYRTRLREGLHEPSDFNGHFKVVSFGCGTGCQFNWVIDLANGKAVGQFETSFGTSYRKNSALLIANPPDADCDTYPPIDAVTFYTVKDDKLVAVKRLDISNIWEAPEAPPPPEKTNAGPQH